MSDLDQALQGLEVSKLRTAIEKNAGFWKKFNDGLISAGAATAITGLGLAAKSGFESLRDKIEKPRAFKRMVETSPSLKKQDPKAVQLTFNTLYGMNRRMAVDPLVASSFVSRNVERAETGGVGAYVDPATVKTLAETASRFSSTKGSPLFDSFKKHGSAAADKFEKYRRQFEDRR